MGDRTENRWDRADELTDEEVRAQSWVGEAIGNLLAGAPGLPTCPARSRLAQVVGVYVEEAEGNLTRFARELGLSTETVWQWRRGKTIPSLGLLLQMCYRLGTTPWRFLTADLVRVRDFAGERPPIEMASLVDPPRRPPPPRRAFDGAAMRCALEAILVSDEQPPPPMRQVAKRLGHGHTELIQHFPALCHAISARYLAERHRKGAEKKRQLSAEIRQAAVDLHRQGLYPSAGRIASLISQPGFVRDSVAMIEWKEVLRELGWRP